MDCDLIVKKSRREKLLLLINALLRADLKLIQNADKA
jgi:hypothetical protein